ncbi:MAG: hypothetical protein H0U76_00635 [Ktedonobacteraceae bacterium]|nr:hypothetical protein [Ktedonobacteraceae bacterium]
MRLVFLLLRALFSTFGAFCALLGFLRPAQKAGGSEFTVTAECINMTENEADVVGFGIVGIHRPCEEVGQALRGEWQAVFHIAGLAALDPSGELFHVSVSICA